jgi:hypothetical protein
MQGGGERSGQQYTKDGHLRRGRRAFRQQSWTLRRAMMGLPGRRQRALDRIGRRLVAEDPGLALRFAFFTKLTRHEAMPGNEQVPRRLQRDLWRAIALPLVVISLLALLAASGLIPSRPTCPAGAHAAAVGMLSESHAAQCQPGLAIRLDTVPVR